MDPKVCVNCGNKNPVNGTNNRLVTENCGHVKCMQCLLEEKAGCIACNALKSHQNGGNVEDSPISEYINNGAELSDDTVEGDIDNNVICKTTHSVPTIHIAKENENIKPDLSHIVEINPVGHKSRFLCTKCNSKFGSRGTKAYHAYCKSDKTPYVCLQCDKKFPNLPLYEYHKQSQHGAERPFKCDECPASFVQKSKLKRHIDMRHSAERKYACQVCKKAFSTGTALRTHARTHSGERPFACNLCSRRFVDSSNLRRHIERHKNQKEPTPMKAKPRPYSCQRCELAFSTRKDMYRHQHVHSDRKTWQCPLCKEVPRHFRRKDNLLRHIRAHSPPPPTVGSGDPAMNKMEALQNGKSPEAVTTTITEDITEENNLKMLNPLPPLSDEVIRQHLYTDHSKDKPQAIDKTVAIDKSYIIEANNARESVIVAKLPEKRVPSPVIEYVHKIRKANKGSNRCKEVPLPPIDESKFYTILTKNLDVGPLPKNTQMLKNILHGESERQEEEKTPEMHWRKKRLTDNE